MAVNENDSYKQRVSAELDQQRAAHDAAVEAALGRLALDPTCKRSLEVRRRTIRALVDAEIDPGRTRESLWKKGKAVEEGIVNRSTYFSKKSKWLHYEPFRTVLDEVLRLEREWEQKRDGRQREARRVAHVERVMTFTGKAFEKLEAMLNFPISEQRVDSNSGAVIVEPIKWDHGSIGRNFAIYDKSVRLALDMDTKRETTKVEDWRDRVVELLKNGEISAEDVAAGYPEYAPELLAAAGIQRK